MHAEKCPKTRTQNEILRNCCQILVLLVLSFLRLEDEILLPQNFLSGSCSQKRIFFENLMFLLSFPNKFQVPENSKKD